MSLKQEKEVGSTSINTSMEEAGSLTDNIDHNSIAGGSTDMEYDNSCMFAEEEAYVGLCMPTETLDNEIIFKHDTMEYSNSIIQSTESLQDTLPLEESHDSVPFTMLSSDLPRNVRVRRVFVINDMVEIFINPVIMTETLQFTFVDEYGADANGVSRDAYTSFWLEFMKTSTKGEDERIPAISPHFQLAEWQAVGRILAKGFLDHDIFPLLLSKAFVIGMLHGEAYVSPLILMESFRKYITDSEKNVIQKAMDNQLEDEDDKEEFLDLLVRMECHTIPTGDEVKPLLIEVAATELVQKPKYAFDGMVTTCRIPLISMLPHPDDIHALYDRKVPTTRKIVKLLQANPENVDENKVFGYLKQYVKGLKGDLVKFLHHVTASDSISVEKIEVQFNSKRGLERAPVAHTCGPLLEISTTYSSFHEFRAEFSNVLDAFKTKFDTA